MYYYYCSLLLCNFTSFRKTCEAIFESHKSKSNKIKQRGSGLGMADGTWGQYKVMSSSWLYTEEVYAIVIVLKFA